MGCSNATQVRSAMCDVRCADGDVRCADGDVRCAGGDVRRAMCDGATCACDVPGCTPLCVRRPHPPDGWQPRAAHSTTTFVFSASGRPSDGEQVRETRVL